MLFSFKKILIMLLSVAFLGAGLFFFAFVVIFLIPIFLILFAFRKTLFKKYFSNNLYSFNNKEDFSNNNDNYIEAVYKKEKDEDV